MSLREPTVPTAMEAVVLGVWIPLAWPVKSRPILIKGWRGQFWASNYNTRCWTRVTLTSSLGLFWCKDIERELLLFWQPNGQILFILDLFFDGDKIWSIVLTLKETSLLKVTEKSVKACKHYSQDRHCLPQGKVVEELSINYEGKWHTVLLCVSFHFFAAILETSPGSYFLRAL